MKKTLKQYNEEIKDLVMRLKQDEADIGSAKDLQNLLFKSLDDFPDHAVEIKYEPQTQFPSGVRKSLKEYLLAQFYVDFETPKTVGRKWGCSEKFVVPIPYDGLEQTIDVGYDSGYPDPLICLTLELIGHDNLYFNEISSLEIRKVENSELSKIRRSNGELEEIYSIEENYLKSMGFFETAGQNYIPRHEYNKDSIKFLGKKRIDFFAHGSKDDLVLFDLSDTEFNSRLDYEQIVEDYHNGMLDEQIRTYKGKDLINKLEKERIRDRYD